MTNSILLTLLTRSSPSNTESSLQSGHFPHPFVKCFPCFCHLKWQNENESTLLIWLIQGNLPYMDLHSAEIPELLFDMFSKFDWSYIISWSLHKVPSEVLTLSVGNTFLPGFSFRTKQHHTIIRIINICKIIMLSAPICSLLFENAVSLIWGH